MSLDQNTALQRAAILRKDSISYNFNIILQPSSYFGLAQITFIVDSINFSELAIDFTGTATSIIVNSIQNPQVDITANFIKFPRKYLLKGRNLITIEYNNNYDADKLGCVTFNDDLGNQYVYTQFQPYAANRTFPCFDQPDLKANMNLSVVAPTQWVAVSNEPSLSSTIMDKAGYKKLSGLKHKDAIRLLDSFMEKVGDDTTLTRFGTTERLPTYILGFAAGPFIQITNSDGVIPMSIYALKSSQPTFDYYQSFIFEITRKSMTFYETFFGVKYPFKKYDQVWVRDCWFSAMQNAAVVTFDQSILSSTYPIIPTQDQLLYLAEIIAHQLSHHWFGNLVTMVWWDDLWLNQSFAEFISVFAIQKINSELTTPFSPPAIYFRKVKTRGYIQDQRENSTHPIRSVVPNTDVAMNIFDGITYNKGAAAIKQLLFLVGENNFALALNTYFTTFQWNNATLADFFSILRLYFPPFVNAESWIITWLQTPSLNQFETLWDANQTSSSSVLTLIQSPYSQTYNILRFHRMQIALIGPNGDITTQEVIVDNSSDKTVLTYDGTTPVSAVFVNYNDYAFIENVIDPVSLLFFKTHINLIKDDVARALIWFNISAMVRQSLIRVDELVTLVDLNLLNSEPLNFVLDKILEQLYSYLQQYTSGQVKVALKTTIFNLINTYINVNGLDSDRKRILQWHLIQYAQTEAQVLQISLQLSRLLPNKYNWQIVKKTFELQGYSRDDKQSFFAQALSIDSSYLSQEARLVCNAIVADSTEFAQIYQSLKTPGGIDIRTRQLLAEGCRNNYQYDEIVNPYFQQYFRDLVDPNVYGKLSYSEYQAFYQGLRPQSTNYTQQISRYGDVISQLSSIPSMTAHCANFQKLIDDLTLIDENTNFNADSNLTLTQPRAIQRSKYIIKQSISYTCHISYNSVSQSYTGLTEINFSLASTPQILPLDFVFNSISDLVVNGYNLSPSTLSDGEFLLIPRVYLNVGVNKIQINYLNVYNNDGLGCMDYIDETDSTEYTYTKFQPAGAHRYFPCFDQPDLKAKAKFNVIIPNNWIAVGNYGFTYQGAFNQADYISKVSTQNLVLLNKYLTGKTGTFYVFSQTDLLPTYLYCIVAGQYYTVTATPDKLYRGIPMTIYCLNSYQQNLNLNADFIFLSTTLSLELYQSKFGVNYQFPKYDSVFCHQFKSGAMENVGVITFNDSYLYGEIVSVDKMASLAVVIAHQCSHNWFGNYVTMQWWNDLWLNESFADFISYYCINTVKDRIPQLATLPSGWIGGLVRAVGGYRQDQMATTHPVRSQVPNVGVASAIFDSITYRKGSMTLKQLMFLMQENKFFLGLQDYFKTFGFKNATIDDFIGCMSTYFSNPEFTLYDWEEMWILTPSLNVITIQWDPAKASATQTLTILQDDFSPDYHLFRYHAVNIAFFQADGSYTTQRVLINNVAKTTITYDASPGIKAILVNQDHQDFMKYRFDPVSQAFFTSNINLIADPFTRMVIYFYLNQQVRDGLESVAQYKNEILNVIGQENEDSVYDFVLKFLNDATGSYVPIPSRPLLRTDLFQFVLNQLTTLGKYLQKSSLKLQIKEHKQIAKNPTAKQQSVKNKSSLFSKNYKQVPTLADAKNRIIILQDLLPIFCSNDSQIDILKQWLQNTYEPLKNLSISPSQGWSVVKLVYSSSNYKLDQKTSTYDAQKAKYLGITAELVYNTCLTLIADDSLMQNLYENVFKTMNQSLTVKASLAEGWNNLVHSDILYKIYKSRYFDDLPLVSSKLNTNHFEFFYTNLKPIDDDIQSTIQSFKAINLTGSAMIGPMKNIRKILDTYQLRSMLYKVNSTSSQRKQQI